MSPRARARWEVVSRREDGGLVIRDIGHDGPHPTVTNDAEAVVSDLLAAGELASWGRLYYFDSEGEPGEILIAAGAFVGFAPWGGS